MVWIRTGLNADPDPAFYLNADPDPDPGAKPMWIGILYKGKTPGLLILVNFDAPVSGSALQI